MSIESDLEAFRELALEEQIRLPLYQKMREGFEYVIDELDSLLEEILRDNQLELVGSNIVSGSEDDEYLQEVGDPVGERKHVSGYSMGVDVVDRSRFTSGVEPGSFVVAYCVQIPAGFYVDNSIYALAPIESSTIVMPETLVAEEDMLPEHDDGIAERIDECMLNEPMDLLELQRFFVEIAGEVSDMQLEFYLNYLDTLMPLDEFEVVVVTDRVVYAPAVGDAKEGTPEDGKLWRIKLHPTHFEYSTEYGLCIAVADEDDIAEDDSYDTALYPLKDIYDLTYTSLEEDDEKIADYSFLTDLGPESSN